MLQCVAEQCGALRCVAVRCSALQCVAVSLKVQSQIISLYDYVIQIVPLSHSTLDLFHKSFPNNGKMSPIVLSFVVTLFICLVRFLQRKLPTYINTYAYIQCPIQRYVSRTCKRKQCQCIEPTNTQAAQSIISSFRLSLTPSLNPPTLLPFSQNPILSVFSFKKCPERSQFSCPARSQFITTLMYSKPENSCLVHLWAHQKKGTRGEGGSRCKRDNLRRCSEHAGGEVES